MLCRAVVESGTPLPNPSERQPTGSFNLAIFMASRASIMARRSPKRFVSFWIYLLIIPAALAIGQAVSGNVDGTVTDSSGAAIPGALISIRDLDRGTIFHATSNAEGNFSQTHLLAGRYEVKAEHSGFAAFLVQASVQVDATTRVDAVLRPTGTESTISV